VHSTQSVLASREAGRDNLIGILSIGIGAISDDQFNAGICGALSGEWWVFEIIKQNNSLSGNYVPEAFLAPPSMETAKGMGAMVRRNIFC
jgi:hypothetical protein